MSACGLGCFRAHLHPVPGARPTANDSDIPGSGWGRRGAGAISVPAWSTQHELHSGMHRDDWEHTKRSQTR